MSEEDLEAHFNAEEATNDGMQAAGGAALSNIDLEMPGDLEACVNRLPRVHSISVQYVCLLMMREQRSQPAISRRVGSTALRTLTLFLPCLLTLRQCFSSPFLAGASSFLELSSQCGRMTRRNRGMIVHCP